MRSLQHDSIHRFSLLRLGNCLFEIIRLTYVFKMDDSIAIEMIKRSKRRDLIIINNIGEIIDRSCIDDASTTTKRRRYQIDDDERIAYINKYAVGRCCLSQNEGVTEMMN